VRQLHPVSFREKFVASGVYTLYQGNLPTGDVEYWSMNEPGEGSCTIRSDRDGRAGTDANWIFEGLVVDGRIERFDVQIQGEVTTAAKFMFANAKVEISQRVNGMVREPLELTVQASYEISPPSLAAQWLFVPRLMGQTAQAWTPDIDTAAGTIQGGYLTAWIIEDVGAAPHPIGEQHVACREFRLSGNAGELTLWFDSHGVLMRFDTDTGERALLTQYVRRPDR
jgi:hypothetical protein